MPRWGAYHAWLALLHSRSVEMRKTVSVLSADVTGSTSLLDPESLRGRDISLPR